MSINDISEDPMVLRSKTWSFYLVLFVAVIPLWSSVPLAWIFAAHSLITGSFSSILFYVALGEVSGTLLLFFFAHGFRRFYSVSIIFISLATYPVPHLVDQEILKKSKLPGSVC